MPPTLTPPTLTTLILLTGVSTLSLNMFLPSLAQMADSLETHYGLISLAVGGYLGVTAILQLIVGPLSDRLGRRPVLLGALAVFCVASLGCTLATNIWVFLGFRMLQGAVIAGSALSLAIVRDTTEERRAAATLGNISMAMAVAPMLGPLLGGVLDAAFGWRATFVCFTLAGLGLLVLCWFDLGETRSPQQPTTAHRGARDLWTDPRFWAFALCGMFSTSAFYIFLAGAPLVATRQYGISTVVLGTYIGSITGGFMFGSFLSARLAARTALTTMMLAGRVLACTGLASGIIAIGSGAASPLVFFGATICVGMGNGITMPSSNAATLSVRPDLAGSAAGLSGALVVAGGAILTTVTSVILPDSAPALPLLALMLAASFAGLLAVVAAMRLPAR